MAQNIVVFKNHPDLYIINKTNVLWYIIISDVIQGRVNRNNWTFAISEDYITEREVACLQIVRDYLIDKGFTEVSEAVFFRLTGV